MKCGEQVICTSLLRFNAQSVKQTSKDFEMKWDGIVRLSPGKIVENFGETPKGLCENDDRLYFG